ncbi:hypothetical protein B7P43_G01541 [Cryptotermes secundus]|uniref:Endonuclease/exonuclease/phosphatase domain-containing protein n=1 Tax=Cryptotermes secundus TaxID=105785 RepID=A0A2J7PF73_9NEOP|nr:hypothetical protein B7P43_G01541 [Cryptotermes secundus]
MNVHAPTEDKIDDIKDRFYEELEHVFDKFPKNPTKILLGDFNVEVGREDIFKPTIGNESLHEISNDNCVRVVNFATSKNLTVKSTMFPHRNIHKFTCTSPDGKIHNQIDHILIEGRRHSSNLDVRFRNKKREYLKDKTDELAMNSKNKNISDLYRGINDFKRGYQPSSNLVKDENGDLLADSHILNRWRNYFSQLLTVSGLRSLGVTFPPHVSTYAGSNPADVVEFLRAEKFRKQVLGEGL